MTAGKAPASGDELTEAFEAQRLVTLLDPDVVWRGDGGDEVASGLGT